MPRADRYLYHKSSRESIVRVNGRKAEFFMAQLTVQRIPTGIASLDPILEGGVPAGSVVLLLGDTGAGNYEFVYSSIVNTLNAAPQSADKGAPLPPMYRYITFTRTSEDVKQEISRSFPMEDMDRLSGRILFEDLSELYFDRSVVPDDWYSRGDIITRLQKRADHSGIHDQLATALNTAEPNGRIIIDSITDIATQSTTKGHWHSLTGLLRGLQRISKQRNLTVYLLLTRGIIKEEEEKEIADIVDAVLLFRWEESGGARRQRVMYFEKFRGVMPHLEERDLVKFAVRISTTGGFEVSNIRVVI
jgi:KaiC/GvpD/RAD55 family RecA-like ATPase